MKEKFITRKRKHIGAMITAIILAVSMSATVFAAEMPTNKLHNVGTEAPEETSTYGLGKPSTDKYVDLNEGALTLLEMHRVAHCIPISILQEKAVLVIQ